MRFGVPDFALATALEGTRAYLQSTRILTAVGWVAIPLNVDVGDGDGDGARRNRVLVCTKSLSKVVSVRICWELFDGEFCNTWNLSMNEQWERVVEQSPPDEPAAGSLEPLATKR